MVISISPTESRPPQGGRGNLISSPTAPVQEVNTFFFFVSLLLAIAVAASWLLLFGYTSMLRSEVVSLNEQQQEKAAQRSSRNEDESRAIVARIEALPPLLKEHIDARSAFTLLDELVQPGVLFSSPSLDVERRAMQLTMAAPSVDDVMRQVVAFEDDERITSIAILPLTRLDPRAPFQEPFFETSVTITLAKQALLADLSEQ